MVKDQQRRRKASVAFAMITLLLLNSIYTTTTLLYAQSTEGYIQLVRFIESDALNIQDPVGLLYVEATDSFLVLNEQAPSGARMAQPQATAITAYEQQLGVATLPQAVDPLTVAYDRKGNRLFSFDIAKQQLLQYTMQANGLPTTTGVKTVAFPEQLGAIGGMAIGADGQSLYLLASGTLLIHKLDVSNGQLQQSSMPAIDLHQQGMTQARGLALHPQNGHLFTLDPMTQRLYELAGNGKLLMHYDLAGLGIGDAQGFTFAPSGDLTDDPAELSLYINDRQTSAQPANTNRQPNVYLPFVMSSQETNAQQTHTNGRIAELSFEAPVRSAQAAAVVTDIAVLVQTVKTFEFSPPSPDPSDIAYISETPYVLNGNRLLISDGEVDEMAIYAGANLYETTLGGVLQRTYTTLENNGLPRLTREPVGMSFNPNDGHLFISDDDGTQPLIEINPGPDKTYRTADDTYTSFSISAAYSKLTPKYIDAEGVEYARIGNQDYLLFADGLNSEVHIVKPGPNGKFDGIDDQVTNFDTDALGVGDPEGIAYNPVSGTIYLVGVPATRVAEISMNGTLLRYVDFSAAKAKKPAGLTFAPGSQNPSQLNLYIVDRNVDNDSNSKENDGYLYEIAIPAAGNLPPTVDAGVNLTITLPLSATLNATVSDDGQPAPPAAVTVTWTKVSGPGDVTFGDATSIDTTASFSIEGNYVLRLTANDGQVSTSDTVTVKVLPLNLPPTVNAGADQKIAIGATASLAAQVSDDGLPNPPSQVTVTWEKVSGPGAVTFATPNSANTTATFSDLGTYVLRITASDSALNTIDELTINVLPPNTPPTVDAGVDQTVGRNDGARLVGLVADDGLPNPPSTVTVTWEKVSGPGTVSFEPADQLTTTATFSAFGVYVLRLTATDSAFSVSDEVTITASSLNQAPTVDAGADQTIPLNATATVAGNVSDDGIPNPPAAVTVHWQVKSGPGDALFGNPNALTTTVNFSALGTYVLELIASDGVREASDTVTILVAEPGTATVVLGQSLTTDVGKTLLLNATIEGDWANLPAGTLTYQWSKVSGPGNITLGSATNLTSTVTFDAPGDYLLQLLVTRGTQVISGTVTVSVNAINQAPTVNAGVDQQLSAPGTIQLAAAVTDDGLPSSINKVTLLWTRVSGPADVVFGNSASATTSATFTANGTYVLKLTATDGDLSSEDTVTVVVGTNSTFKLFLPLTQQ